MNAACFVLVLGLGQGAGACSDSDQGLAVVRPGMTRAEVENALGSQGCISQGYGHLGYLVNHPSKRLVVIYDVCGRVVRVQPYPPPTPPTESRAKAPEVQPTKPVTGSLDGITTSGTKPPTR